MNETNLVRYCISYLTLQGHFVWRNNSGVTRSKYTNKAGITSDRLWRSGIKGGSDIIGVTKDGRFLAVECKIYPNKTTFQQDMFLAEVKDRGGIVLVIYSPEQIEKVNI